MKMLIVWFVVLIVFSVLCGKLLEVPDSSKVFITSHMWVGLGTSWIGAHVPTGTMSGFVLRPILSDHMPLDDRNDRQARHG
jgi:uncharacterized membrane protein